MAEAAILQIMLENLNSLIKDEIGLIMGAGDEMNKLASNLTAIKAVLADAGQKQLKSEAIRDWLMKLRDLVYEIEDILDECATHVSKSKHMSSIRRHGYSLKIIPFKHKIGRRMKQVNERLEVVAAERQKFHLQREVDLEGPSEIATTRETVSILNDTNHVYGRDDEKEEIVDILVNRVKKNQGISILPVVGLGGLGKTTLAQLVSQDPRIVEHFDKILWICVTENFVHETLIKGIIESGTGKGSASDSVQLDNLVRQLRDLLIHKRFLLVLDDMWNDDQEKWSRLRNALPCGTPGSSIIVTTRMKKVAEIMATVRPYCELKELSDEHCWMLLKQRAFGSDDEQKYRELQFIGKQIVGKCAGVPLAAKAIGGLLRFKRNEKEWENVRDSEIWDLPEEETMILPSLILSYLHLPSKLKPCFAYCAIFPKGSKIYKEKLISLWMSHGYISSTGRMEAEDVGDHVWNELILRSFFQTSNGDGEYILMHDLLHDLAQSIMEDKVPEVQPGTTFSPSASNNKIREVNFSELYMAFPKSTLTEMDVSCILKKYNRLRVLNLRGESLPSSIDSLIHLRFLVLFGYTIRNLPNSLCRLWNLQLLNLSNCIRLKRFPKKMKYLKNLRHLLLEGCSSLRETPSTVRELTSLRTLSQFIVGCSKGHRLEELECLKNLGGKLEIGHLERVKNSIDAKKAKLVEKHNLSDLKLEWEVKNASSDIRGEAEDEKVLEALEFHPNVKRLSISGFRGRHFPNWMKNSTIVRVSIYDCEKLMDVSPLEELQHLEFLLLSDLATVEYIGEGGNAMQTYFPALKQLLLFSLPKLQRLFKEEVGLKMCPRLEELSVSECPSLTMSPLTSLNELNKFDWDKSLVPSFQYFDSFERLVVRIGENMMRIPSELLERYKNKIEILEIRGAQESCMPAGGLRGLHSLEQLRIVESKKLTCLPMGWFDENTTLRRIEIKDCPEFEEISEESIKHLLSLWILWLKGLPKMACLPKSIRHLSSLRALRIEGLPQLASLPDWLGDLTSLGELSIVDCPKLASLPDSIKGMMGLMSLFIRRCPNLERRCEERKGEDWHKIAHIPVRHIIDE